MRKRRCVMNPVEVGQVLFCEKCGVELTVTKNCDTTCVCNIVCCDHPLQLKTTEDNKAHAA